MTNLHRAFEAITAASDGFTDSEVILGKAFANLKQAGLIIPDLPEPYREVALHTPEWFLDGPISLVVSDPSEGIVSYGSDTHNGAFRLVLTKEEAEGIALALLAAAQYAETDLLDEDTDNSSHASRVLQNSLDD